MYKLAFHYENDDCFQMHFDEYEKLSEVFEIVEIALRNNQKWLFVNSQKAINLDLVRSVEIQKPGDMRETCQ